MRYSCPWTTPVYPRVCGETRSSCDIAAPAQGLSPRMRGNHGQVGHQALEPGSIPAYAGKPPAASTGKQSRRVYPRVCGETSTPCSQKYSVSGLSPRMRGNPPLSVAVTEVLGSIPAYAGKPRPAAGREGALRVYPRVCGETSGRERASAIPSGLSPRMRGNQETAGAVLICPGSIPAYAGKPKGREATPLSSGVYPRVCGETCELDTDEKTLTGLSPRMRGNLVVEGMRRTSDGSIPAYAGKPLA